MGTTSDHLETKRPVPPPSQATAAAGISDVADDDLTSACDTSAVAVLAGPPEAPDRDEPHGLAAIEAEISENAESDAQPDEALTGETVQVVGLPETLMRIVDARINIWRRLNQMEQRREEIRNCTDNRDIKDEASRQGRELKKIPARDVIETSLTRLKDRRGKLPPAAVSTSAKAKNAPPEPNQLMAETLDLGIEQAELLTKRAKLDAAVVAAALPAAEWEPLLKVCRDHSLNPDALFGWTYYAMGLFQRIGHYRGIEKEYNRRLAQAYEERKGKGLMSVLGGNREQDIPPLDPNVGRILQAARQELQAVEPQLTELYWTLYEDLAWLLCRPADTEDHKNLNRDECATVRMYMRYGLVSSHGGMISQDVAAYLRVDCTDDVHAWSNTPETTNVVYADEYIEGIARRKLTVSPDEDLELNNRNSPEWRADRVWRQAVISQTRRELIETRLGEIRATFAELQKQVEQKEERYKTLRADGKKVEANAISQELIGVKAQASRLSKAVEQIDHIVLPKIRDQAVESAAKLVNEERVLTLEAVVRREARFIRRSARLAARLKEPFPQFVLRDSFEPLRSDHHSRKAVLDEIARIENADRFIFHQVLVPNKKADRRVTVRMSPTFLVSPCRGQMAFSFCERRWDDNGRLVLPLIAQRQGSLSDMLINMLADFRWDCSKEEAGMDWIVADALCAGYAAVRWAVRKLPEKSQKMMGVDPKLKDKPNWRAHYRLFVTSAKDAGRLLFNKCDEVYKIVVKYIGLPPGVEVLRRD